MPNLYKPTLTLHCSCFFRRSRVRKVYDIEHLLIENIAKDKKMTMFKKLPFPISSSPYLLVMVILLSACAPGQSQLPPPIATTISLDTSEYSGELSWWACRFKMTWPLDAEANGAVDLLLAHAVVEPVLRKHAKEIYWWRFHRRAVRDKLGHQFSFLFFTDSVVASEIMAELRQSPILQQALKEKVVEKTIFHDPTKPTRPQIKAMSDPHWSQTLQRNWPSFIMGVSALWLGLIDDQMATVSTQSLDVSGLLESYHHADTAITGIWREEGQHAFLHHLNAIFGYEPLLIRKEIMF